MARAIMIILDGMGVGGARTQPTTGDAGSDTLANMARAVGGLTVPTLASLGLGNLHAIDGVAPVEQPAAGYGRLQELSAGKDSTTGHWELLGQITDRPYPTYPNGFPPEVIDEFTRLTGYGVLGNKAASGTAIIQELGDEHLATGKLIVYTSADSVFQIAAHDQVCSLEELYRVCEISRAMLKPPHEVSRVIARRSPAPAVPMNVRPIVTTTPSSPRTSSCCRGLQQHGVTVRSIGKIYDLYAGVGIERDHAVEEQRRGHGAAGDDLRPPPAPATP